MLAAWTAHALMIVPVSGLFQNGPQITADRYSYLSCVPYALLVGGAVAMACGRARSVGRKGMVVGGAVAGVVALASMTFRQTGYWRDSITLWSRVVEVEPWNAFGNNNRGVHLMAEGKYDLAEKYYRVSLQTEPFYARALCNLGILYVLRGDTPEAIKYFRQAISADPRYAPAHHQLGSVWFKMGDNEAARASFRTALELDPRDPRVYNNLAVAENALYDPAAAVQTLRRGLKIAPDDLHLNRMLAWLLATALDDRLRSGAEAVRRAELANRLANGTDFHCLLTLSAAYAEVGRFADAMQAGESAMAVAIRQGDARQAQSAQQCVAAYRAGRPYRE
jgi:Flp pilus assembly protein TadD